MKKSNNNAKNARNNNARAIVRIDWVIVETCAPRERTTFMQDLRELAPAFGIMALFMGALVAGCAAVVAGCAAIAHLIG